MSDALPTIDNRPVWLRALVLVGIFVLLAAGVPLAILGFLLLDETFGPFIHIAGLLLVQLGVIGVIREFAELRHRRHPPRPRLGELDGEPALVLPRAAFPSVLSAWTVASFALPCLLGIGFAIEAGRWVLGAVLALLGGGILRLAAPDRAKEHAGGLWFTPRRLVHENDGVRWEIPWEDVVGAAPDQPLPVVVEDGRLPEVSAGWKSLRHRDPAVVDGALMVNTQYLAGGAVLASYLVEMAARDPGFRAKLGTEQSLPSSDGTPTTSSE